MVGLTLISVLATLIIHPIWLLLGLTFLCIWWMLRRKLLVTLGSLGPLAWAMSFLLDLVRGCAVFLGASAFLGDWVTRGRWNPMSSASRGVSGKANGLRREDIIIQPEQILNEESGSDEISLPNTVTVHRPSQTFAGAPQ